MQQQVILCRDDARVEKGEQGFFLVSGVVIQHFISTSGRILPLNSSTEISFRAGNVYRVFTGISISGLSSPAALVVRTAKDLWAHGAEARRVEIIDGELVVYLTTIEEFQFRRSSPMFEVAVLANTLRDYFAPVGEVLPQSPTPEVTRGATKAAPGLERYQETQHYSEPAPAAQRTQQANPEGGANEEARVQAWLNEEDTKGKVVEQGGAPVDFVSQHQEKVAQERAEDASRQPTGGVKTAAPSQQEILAHQQAEADAPAVDSLTNREGLADVVASMPPPPPPPAEPKQVNSVNLDDLL
jgi:hypothetical protein